MTAYQMMMDDVLMDALVKGMSDAGDLTPRERGKFNAFWTVALQSYQHSYFQIRSGAFDPREFGGWWQVLRNNFESPGFRDHWDRRKYVLAEEFREFVETDVLGRDPAPHG